jgi:[CysO sulfur-carrier protein]-S-L-cysteine hydrolase
VNVIIGRHAYDAMVAHAREAAPAECCGLLVGNSESIVEAVKTRNLASDPSRFEMDPGDHIRTRREARNRGLDVLGFYHSHPRSQAVPSASDLAEAWYPHYLYLIVSVRAQPPDVRLYRLNANGFVEVAWQLQAAEERSLNVERKT